MIAAKTNQNVRTVVNRQFGDVVSKNDYPPPPPNLSMHCPEPPRLKYNITAIDGGVLLSIWEPAPKSDVRVKPFLFMSRHRLPSELEARKMLGHYLLVYRRATQQV
jgi:hypothetical protein